MVLGCFDDGRTCELCGEKVQTSGNIKTCRHKYLSNTASLSL